MTKLLLVVILLVGCTAQITGHQLIERDAPGLRPWHMQVGEYAQSWANTMARDCYLRHSGNVPRPPGWRAGGENVGSGANVPQVHAAFLASPSHAAVIRDPRYTHSGVGVAEGCGLTWVVYELSEIR